MRVYLMRLAFVLGFSGTLLAAEPMVTEVISIGYRDAREVATMLRPMVPPPGTVTSLSDKLIVKTTPANLREIRALLQTIDKAPANLLVSVKQALDEEVRRDLAEGFAEIKSGDSSVSAGSPLKDRRGLTASGSDGESSVQARVIREQSEGLSSSSQQIRVLEGNTAFIAVGESRPIREQTTVVQGGRVIVQDSVTYADANSGFYVRPRLSGNRVSMEIFPALNRFNGARIQTREAQTTVSGQLGKWIAISGASQSSTRTAGEIGRSVSSRESSEYTVYVKVTKLSE